MLHLISKLIYFKNDCEHSLTQRTVFCYNTTLLPRHDGYGWFWLACLCCLRLTVWPQLHLSVWMLNGLTIWCCLRARLKSESVTGVVTALPSFTSLVFFILFCVHHCSKKEWKAQSLMQISHKSLSGTLLFNGRAQQQILFNIHTAWIMMKRQKIWEESLNYELKLFIFSEKDNSLH